MNDSIRKRRNFIPLKIIIEEDEEDTSDNESDNESEKIKTLPRSILQPIHKIIIYEYEQSRKIWLNIIIIASIIIITSIFVIIWKLISLIC
jgi:hypothetical protein